MPGAEVQSRLKIGPRKQTLPHILYVDIKTKIVTPAQRPLPLYVREFIVLIQNLSDGNRPIANGWDLLAMKAWTYIEIAFILPILGQEAAVAVPVEQM